MVEQKSEVKKMNCTDRYNDQFILKKIFFKNYLFLVTGKLNTTLI